MASTTILFVPGAWHGPSCFHKVVKELEVAGYNTDVVHLPSVGPTKHLLDFSADVLQIRKQIEQAVDSGQKVVVVVHSYGALPANEAIQGLDWQSRQGNSQIGGVVHLFFCCSFIIPEGKSLLGAFGGQDLPWYRVSEDRLEVNPANPADIFYNDMPQHEVEAAIASLRPHSYLAFHSPCTYAAWKVVPSTYLYCTKDASMSLSVQKKMVEDTAKGYPVKTETVDASHSPFYSVPTEMAQAIRKAAGEFT